MWSISRVSHVPLYHQIYEQLKERIISGRYKPGDCLPSEEELAKVLSVSRMTARRAVSLLANEGMVRREQGRGTVVVSPKIVRTLAKLTSFSEDMTIKQVADSCKVLKVEHTVMPAHVAEALTVGDERDCVKLIRLRSTDDSPIALQINYFPYDRFAGLLTDNLPLNSVYKLFEEHFGIVIYRGDQTVEARLPSGEEASLLGIPTRMPVLHLERVTYDKDDIPIELGIAVYRSDRFKWRGSLLR